MIGPFILGEAKTMIAELLDQNQDKINEAYIQSGAGISISLTIKIDPSKRADFQVLEIGINFVVNRAKDQIAKEVSEKQSSLFKAVEKLRPKKGSGVDSVTISTANQSVTLKPI